MAVKNPFLTYFYHFIANKPPPGLLEFRSMQKKLPWNIIVLLGSGFALAEACKVRNSGADLIGSFISCFSYVRAKITGIADKVHCKISCESLGVGGRGRKAVRILGTRYEVPVRPMLPLSPVPFATERKNFCSRCFSIVCRFTS